MTPTSMAEHPMPEIWRMLIVHRTVLTYPELDPFEGVLSYID